jgi:hypothetical protein
VVIGEIIPFTYFIRAVELSFVRSPGIRQGRKALRPYTVFLSWEGVIFS